MMPLSDKVAECVRRLRRFVPPGMMAGAAAMLIPCWLYGAAFYGLSREADMPLPSVLSPDGAGFPQFIDCAGNHITAGDSLRKAVRERLERAQGDGRTFTILHIGDSHLQAGFFTNTVRDSLQSLLGSAGRGFIVPLALAGSNGPRDYSVKSPCQWHSVRASAAGVTDAGLGGYALRGEGTGDSVVRFTIYSPGRPFDRVRVFLHPQAPALEAGDSLALDISCPASVSPYVADVYLGRPVDSLTLSGRLSEEFGRAEYYGFSLEKGEGGLLYHVVGVNGMHCNHLLDNNALIDGSALFGADMIIVSLGTNEAYARSFNPEYIRERYGLIIDRLRDCNPDAVIVMTTPMEFARRTRVRGRTRYPVCPNSALMRDVIVSLGAERDVPVWDFYTVAGGPGASLSWNAAGMMRRDRLHLSVEGYELQGRLFYRALAEFMGVKAQ